METTELQSKIEMLLWRKLDRIHKTIRTDKVFSNIQAGLLARAQETGMIEIPVYSEQAQEFIDNYISESLDEFIVDIVNGDLLIEPEAE
jgi:hypothetical protein